MGLVFFVDTITLVGFAAGTLTTICFVPQVLKAWKTKSTHDLSIEYLVILTVGIFLWLIYGLGSGSGPVIAANVFSLGLILILDFMKLKFG